MIPNDYCHTISILALKEKRLESDYQLVKQKMLAANHENGTQKFHSLEL